MNNIDKQLNKIKESGKIGLMTHVVVGYPTITQTKEIILALAEESDFIELQIPFSDPIADGPTIMQASDIALQNGVTTKTGLHMMKEMSAKVEIPLIFMCYYNTVFNYGVEKFCKEAAEAGAAGLIIPDVPPEEEAYEHLVQAAEKYGLYVIRVISPASSLERLKKNAEIAKGFVYCVSRYGVTGTQQKLDSRLSTYLEKVKSIFNLPTAVGFGISKPPQVKALQKSADIAVVGSAIIELVKKTSEKKIDKTAIKKFIHALKG